MPTADIATIAQPAALDPAALLAGFPGPGLLVDPAGAVVDRNTQADDFVAAFAIGALDDLRHVLAGAAAGHATVQDTIHLPQSLGGAVFDITGLPVRTGVDQPAMLVLARNVTLDRNLRRALVESRQRYRDLVECSSEFGWETDSEGRFVFVSPRGALAYAAEHLIGQDPWSHIAAQYDQPEIWPFSAQQPVEDVTVWMRTAAGETACLAVSATPLIGPDGRWLGARGVCRDVTNERAQSDALARARRRDRMLSDLVREIRTEIRSESVLGQSSRAIAETLAGEACWIYLIDDANRAQCAATYPTDAAPPDRDVTEALTRLITHAGGDAVQQIDDTVLVTAQHNQSINAVIGVRRGPDAEAWNDDDRTVLVGVANQVGIAIAQAHLHDELQKLSCTDGLTGLLNRRAFMDEAGRRYAHAYRTKRPAAVLYVDINNFKRVNDTLGHTTGDRALTKVSELISRNLRAGDIVGRLGGDEFVVWLDETDLAGAETKAATLVAACSQLDALSTDPDHPLGLSIGAAASNPQSDENLTGLLDRADRAMYAAKQRAGDGPSRYVVGAAPA